MATDVGLNKLPLTVHEPSIGFVGIALVLGEMLWSLNLGRYMHFLKVSIEYLLIQKVVKISGFFGVIDHL